ncbi:TetR/AcrR family transcriptional regulator, partial [Pseudactinotalea sp.]|uniref:TetR/AcrR family transcriptional regulator n=1 Tax=Pseudactinotalea sp. TaxID=1926260 RepID=UPI003B3A292E
NSIEYQKYGTKDDMKTAPPAPARRLPRAEVRRRLIDAAAAVFTELGYADATVERIALSAGFTKGAVYSNFGGKQDLFAAVLQERSETERERLLVETRDDPTDVPRTAAKIVAESITSDTQREQLGLEFAARAARDTEARQAWTPLRRTQREVAERTIRAVAERSGLELRVDPELAALILHCLTNGLAMEHLADPEKVDRPAIEQAMASTISALTTAHQAGDH